MNRMQRLAYLTGFGGFLLLVGLIVHQGLPEILQALDRAGWLLLLLLPAHCVPLLLDAQGWKVLLAPIDPMRRATLWFLFRVACVREAVGRLLPSAGIGGEVVGIRLTRLRLDDTAGVTATVIVEVLITLVTQYLFCGLGIVMLMAATTNLDQVWSIGAALLLSLPIPVIVYFLLRHGAVFERLGSIAKKLFGSDNRFAIGLDGARIDTEVHRLFAQPLRLLQALAWQFSGYLIGSFETWFALALLGHRVSPGTALAIEALTQAVRHASFFVPGGLGVQEAGVMLFGHMAGINGEVALSLALIKRLREILFGVPALLAWQWLEARLLGRLRSLAKGDIIITRK
ncbi:MAG: lysylphosphatidylglycerol synthase domain-containing protein [Burkholderiales bacterium]